MTDIVRLVTLRRPSRARGELGHASHRAAPRRTTDTTNDLHITDACPPENSSPPPLDSDASPTMTESPKPRQCFVVPRTRLLSTCAPLRSNHHVLGHAGTRCHTPARTYARTHPPFPKLSRPPHYTPYARPPARLPQSTSSRCATPPARPRAIPLPTRL